MLEDRDFQPPEDARKAAQGSERDSESPDAAAERSQVLDDRFKELFGRYYKSTVVLLGRKRIPREEARELAQETFLRVYLVMKATTLTNEWGYIATVARNLALNHIRDTKKAGEHEVSLEDLPSPANLAARMPSTGRPPPSQEEELIARKEESSRRRRLRAAIDRLPETLRQPLLLQLGGASQREIQVALRLTPNAVKSRLRDARRKLRRWLGEDPVGLDEPMGPVEDGRDRKR